MAMKEIEKQKSDLNGKNVHRKKKKSKNILKIENNTDRVNISGGLAEWLGSTCPIGHLGEG